MARVSVNQQTSTEIFEVTGTSYTLAAGDAGKMIRCTNAAATSVTIPSGLGWWNATIKRGKGCEVRQAGDGQVTIVAGAGVNPLSELSMRKIAAKQRSIAVIATGTDQFDLDASLAA